MNIIHLCPTKTWDDDARLTLDLCKAHRDMGHQVDVFVRRLNPVGDTFYEAEFLAGKMRMSGMLNFMAPLRLARHIDSLTGTVTIHCHSFKSAIIALDARRLIKKEKQVFVVMNRDEESLASTARKAIINELDRIIDPNSMTNAKEVYDGLC